MDLHLRHDRKNTYSLAVLAPFLPGSDFVRELEEGIVIYSFCIAHKGEVYSEVDRAGTDSVYIAGGLIRQVQWKICWSTLITWLSGKVRKPFPHLWLLYKKEGTPYCEEDCIYGIRESRINSGTIPY
jgi:hypothetical protein